MVVAGTFVASIEEEVVEEHLGLQILVLENHIVAFVVIEEAYIIVVIIAFVILDKVIVTFVEKWLLLVAFNHAVGIIGVTIDITEVVITIIEAQISVDQNDHFIGYFLQTYLFNFKIKL